MPKIATSYRAKPIPLRQFDWTAWYDGDEPNDAGGMRTGSGRTQEDAIANLLSNHPPSCVDCGGKGSAIPGIEWTIQEYGDDECPTLVLHRGETENRICFMATPGSHGDPAMIEADAKLIAAAPDLLAALKVALTALERMHALAPGGPLRSAALARLNQARAAIAKAEEQ